MALILRDPTGKPPWPITLISGIEKSGKTFAAAQASASKLIDRTIWFPFGEDDPDEYGAIPGARFKIATHNGTYRALYNAMNDALALEQDPSYDPKVPDLWVLDSGGRLWALISDMAQVEANRRWAKRRENQGKPIPEDGVRITPDLWNTANARWEGILNLMRKHKGPSIITARLGLKSIVNEKTGEPTGAKDWKVEAQKGLPFDVGVIVEMHARGENYLTGVRSLRWVAKEPRWAYPDFTMEDLWTKLGLADAPAGERVHTTSTGEQSAAADDEVVSRRNKLLTAMLEVAKNARVTVGQLEAKWAENHDHDIRVTTDLGSLELLLDDLRTYAANQAAQTQGAVA